MLADYPASPPRQHVEAFLEHQDRTPPARRAQTFPSANLLEGVDLELLVRDEALEPAVLTQGVRVGLSKQSRVTKVL